MKGLNIRNCEIHHIGEKDGDVSHSAHINMSDVIFENNEIYDCGRRGLSINVDGSFKADSVKNILIQDNYFHNGWHTTGPDIDNSGDAGTVFDSIIIRRNIIENDETIASWPSNNMYFELNSASAIKTQNVWIYDNLLTYAKGKSLLFYVNGNASNTFDDIYIHNNVFYDFNDNVNNQGLIQFDSINGVFTDVYFRNNITYSSVTGNDNIRTDSWLGTGITFDYNLHYTTGSWGAFNYDETSYTSAQWSTYKTVSGRETNSPTPADPLLYNPPDTLNLSNRFPRYRGWCRYSWLYNRL